MIELQVYEELAARILDEIPAEDRLGHRRHYHHDRKRVESDLAGLKECFDGDLYADAFGISQRHAQRYADGLRRSARLYGVRQP